MTYYRHYLDKNPSDCCKPKQHYSELVMFSLKAKPQVLSVLLTEWYVEERTFEVQKITQSPFLIASWVSWTCQSWNLEQLGEHSEFACSKLDENLRPSLELRRKCCKILSLSGFLGLIRSLFYLKNLFFIIYNCVSVTKRIMFLYAASCRLGWSVQNPLIGSYFIPLLYGFHQYAFDRWNLCTDLACSFLRRNPN